MNSFVRPSLERLVAGTGNKIPLMDTAFFGQSKLNDADRTLFEAFVAWSNGNLRITWRDILLNGLKNPD